MYVILYGLLFLYLGTLEFQLGNPVGKLGSLCASQVDAVQAVRTLKASRGEVATASQESHAQRYTETLFKKHGLTLPVPVECQDHEVLGIGLETVIQTYYIKTEEWVKFLVRHDLTLLAGTVGDAGSNLRAFWEVYRLEHPGHTLYQNHQGRALEKVIPLLVHGDEGRGVRKSPYLVVSIESPIGSAKPEPLRCKCQRFLNERPDLPAFREATQGLISDDVVRASLGLRTNHKGHSYVTRHLLFGLSSSIGKKNPHVTKWLFQTVVDSFERLMQEGVEVPGHGRYFAALVGCKGDMDWHVKGYELTRCYLNAQSRGQGLLCHACEAASGAAARFPFEDFSEQPKWLPTLYRSRPWIGQPTLAGLPFDRVAPERAIVPDPLHVIKLGLARDLIGGVILVLARKGFFDFPGSTRNVADRLVRAHSSFTLFCAVTREHPSLRGFTKQFFHLKSMMSAPWVNAKGSDAMSLLRWLAWFLRLNLRHPVQAGFDVLLTTMLQTCESILSIFQLLHSHMLVLERPCATKLYVLVLRTLRGYRKLGLWALQLSMRAFIIKPKAHALHHIAITLKLGLPGWTSFDDLSGCPQL